jgi:hypothetical protein
MAVGAAVDWWLSGGIPAANVVEHVENPTVGQLYAGGTLATAWSISFRTNLASVPTAAQYAFDSATGRVIIGIGFTTLPNGFFLDSWNNITLFATGDHTYMLIQTGTSVQAYRDNVAIGSAVSNTKDLGGSTTWRSSAGGAVPWAAAVSAGHVANIALDATQRAGLHASMMALA